ncbi:uncharacterized protein LOC111066308 [Drosophila obscura]|uniref:uncharacterized protein LOC111066308 n=1 Tax=Drosophila obscura TaxID=7282 RepID=UPI000BA1889A|nr:uncharacterized protein LOC111066308 [Drosophila obscura]XP_041451080.1 uncharacterized protein LOC111066308 [Drosophila obscura]
MNSYVKIHMWSDENTLFLIKLVRNSRYVWDSTHVSYKQKTKRQNFWLEAAKKMNRETGLKMEVAEVKKKWQNIRAYYYAERNKLMKAARSGAQDGELRSAWKYMDEMDFMADCRIPPGYNPDTSVSHSSMTFNDGEESYDEEKFPVEEGSPVHEQLEFCTPWSPAPKRKRSDSESNDGILTKLSDSQKMITDVLAMPTKSNPHEDFGAFVGDELKKLDDDLGKRLEIKILQLITDFKIKQLGRDEEAQ